MSQPQSQSARLSPRDARSFGFSESAVAVIGVSCAFPGVPDYESLWNVLAEGRETITHFTDAQLEAAGVRADRLKAPNYIKSKGVLEGVENFDHELFGIEPDRALLMDPQHRVFIQKCWSALEDAGYDPRRHQRPIGLFAGSALNTYVLNNLRHADRTLSRKFSSIEFLLMTDKDFLTTQTSYLLGLTGPSVTIQTACSTSLAAIHYACESVLNGESDMALAGAVTIYAPQVKGYLYEPDSIISPDGHVRSFDAKGGGTVYSSGVAVVVLKRLQDALNDNDQIYAVIRATAINNDGGRKAAFKMPSADGIAEAASQALALAEVPVESIGMIEANGSGTAFGDPIEVEALTRAYDRPEIPRQSIPIGSIKSNIGHMNVTAGMGAVLKTIASLQNGQVPPSINFEHPNPRIRFEESPLRVCTQLTEWPISGHPRRAGVNVYGVGGTNGHAILEQAPAVQRAASLRLRHLFMLSARTPAALARARERLVEHLRSHPGLEPADVAFTLDRGRQQLSSRTVALVPAGPLQALDIKFEIEGAAPPQGLKICLAMTNVRNFTPAGVIAAKESPEFAQVFNEIADAIPELAAALDAFSRDQAFGRPQQRWLDIVTDLAIARMLLDAGLCPDAVYAGGSTLAALAVAGVLDVAVMAELHRVVESTAPDARAQALRAVLSTNTLHALQIALYSPVTDILMPAQRAPAIEDMVQLLMHEHSDATLRKAQADHAWLYVVPGSKRIDGLRVHAVTPFVTGCDASQALLAEVAILWAQGATVRLSHYYRDESRSRISLPTYSFEPVRHWVDIPVEAKASNYDVAL